MAQQFVVYILLGLALMYLGFKFLMPKKKKKGDKHCDKCE
jgi:uncharacterized membrane protein YuzA (DUF378 family)